MKNFIDLEHDRLAKQWTSIRKTEKAIEEKEKQIQSLMPTVETYQSWHEADGPYYLAQAKKELEALKSNNQNQ
jgi:hypothetical protein